MSNRGLNVNAAPNQLHRRAIRIMTSDIIYTPLAEQDHDELVAVLLNESVYEHIGGLPSEDDFKLHLRRVMEGPPSTRKDEQWLNYVARLSSTGQILGRLEATLHDGLAEVAFLYDPQNWGNGYAKQGLLWLHGQLQSYEQISIFWGTTAPANVRSAALLHRCGYVKVSSAGLPRLYSYDIGDYVFSRPSSA